ncbi:MAG: HAD-IA family hydrolase, partial [Actinobacteria bacterium]|nr:HAD-IA family hydrolase [Actinomycetota bacterium]
HDGVEALPGAADLLRALPKIALVTSAPRSLALVRMKAAGLPIPEVVVTADDVEFGKPRPDCYLLAAELLGVSASDAIVFEDAEAGVLAGLAAGATVVVVGALDVAATHGLLRVPDYSGVTVEVVGDEFTLTIDTAEARR